MSIDTIHDCKIGGKRARLVVYSKYDKAKTLGGPIAYPWEIWIDGEGVAAEGEELRDSDSRRVMWEHVAHLRKERRKK